MLKHESRLSVSHEFRARHRQHKTRRARARPRVATAVAIAIAAAATTKFVSSPLELCGVAMELGVGYGFDIDSFGKSIRFDLWLRLWQLKSH